MFRERSDELRYTIIAVDLLLSFVAFLVAFALRFLVIDSTLGDFRGISPGSYVFFGCLIALSQTVVLSLLGLYRNHQFLAFLDEIGTLVAGVVFNIVLSFAILYFVRVYEVSRLLPALYGLLLLIFLLFGHNLFRRVLIHRRRKGLGLQDLIIVGGNPTALRTAEALERNVLSGFHVKGFVLEGHERALIPPEKVLGTLKDLEGLLNDDSPVDLIYTGDKNYQENLKKVL